MFDLNVINPDGVIKAFHDLQCGSKDIVQISSKDFEIKHSDSKPLGGFKFPDGFPNCCPAHKGIFKTGLDRFAAFPNCCEAHKKLNNASWFSKSHYAYLPYKLTATIIYTWDCISKCIENQNWYKEITDYIEYTKKSYGQLPDGYGPPVGLELYIHNIEKGIEASKELPENKKELLLTFLRKYWQKEEEVEYTDINLLISKYKEWLKIFPFELSFLTHLKPYFEKRIPILKGPGETNIYTGLTGFKLTSKKELIGFLTAATVSIIKEINTHRLYEQGLLNDIGKTNLEVLLSQRKIEIEELDKTGWDDRKEYIKLLKKWLSGEKKFLKELSNLMNTQDTFLNDIIDGIKLLQKNDTNEQCILSVREGKGERETLFRYWFKTFFTSRYPDSIVTAEEEQGEGRIDLKIYRKPFGEKIIEFKGWWNQDKPGVVQQICSYLTEFESQGYIFMINNTRGSIVEKYNQIIAQSTTSYIDGTWKQHEIPNSGFTYFESKHQANTTVKTLYHFIFNAYF